MTADHLDKGVSISGELVERGIRFKAQSRAVSGFDRLLGNLAELANAPLERRAARIRAEQAVIEALGRAAVDQLDQDAGLAKNILRSNVQRLSEKYFNKQDVAVAALEDLTSRPPQPGEAASGPDKLDAAFLSRLERYAEDADDQTAQEKWARVLAGEIRQPGRFAAKTMRLIDEISPDVAQKFHLLCRYLVGDCIPKCLSGELKFDERVALENAGLLKPSESGTIRVFNKSKDGRGENEIWMAVFGEKAIGISTNIDIHESGFDGFESNIIFIEGKPGIPVYLLTPEGLAISTLAENEQEESWRTLVQCVASYFTGYEVMELISHGESYIIAARHGSSSVSEVSA